MAELLKNLYSEEYIELISSALFKYYPSFDSDRFHKQVFDNKWKDLELKQRMRHISTTLKSFLPIKYKYSIQILKSVSSDIGLQYNLQNIIFQDFVELYGLDEFEVSFDALEHFTKTSTSEFAIRAFILKDEQNTMNQMKQWSQSENEHVRRLSSEGCRPFLPWAVVLHSFKINPSKVMEILSILIDDSSEYVRKSVANNLNDISKNHPSLVIDIVKQHINQNTTKDSLLKHACRTLLKKGDKEVLKLFGFIWRKDLKIEKFMVPSSVKKGDTLEFSFILSSENTLGLLRIEYALQFVRQKGKYSKKVFMLNSKYHKENQKEFQKRYSFKPISTRKYYSGEHIVTVIVNGIEIASKKFDLEK
ncbi:DNA alkylation repair protein [Arcobacteraceae bacterium]|nr:DNA alkylation repair protein [Arcobacteraceae bacterium]